MDSREVPEAAGLFILFVSLVGILGRVKSASRFRPLFKFLPVPFYCYFIPMAASTAGIIPSESALYPFLSKYFLPVCLAFLLINVDVPALARLGRPALAAMFVGAAGIMAGAVISFWIFHERLPAESWKSVGALSASWIGGSSNMLAVKEALNTPEAVFSPVIVVDTLLAYGWMAFLISLAGIQSRFDAWNRVDPGLMENLAAVRLSVGGKKALPWIWVPAVCLVLGAASVYVGDVLGEKIRTVFFTKSAWSVLLVTTAGLGLSLTGFFSAEAERTEISGNFLLCILLAAMGARGSLTSIVHTPYFLVTGIFWMMIHGVFLLIGGRILKSPLFLLASASQACVGGPISAPLVAAVYRPSLSAAALLLAIVGNIFGTYLGLVTAHLCRLVGG